MESLPPRSTDMYEMRLFLKQTPCKLFYMPTQRINLLKIQTHINDLAERVTYKSSRATLLKSI